GVVDSLQQSLRQINEEDVTVNLVTSIPVSLPSLNTVQLSQDADNVDYFSGIEFTNEEETDCVYRFKGMQGEKPFYPFTGIFRTVIPLLKEAVHQTQSQTDLLQVVEKLNALNSMRMEKVEWIDVGHEINYADARRKMISSRSFNSIAVSSHSGILTKRSAHRQKLANETKYVTMLPTELQVFYPRIFSNAALDGIVNMEYYGYPNLSEYQLYRDIPDVQWVRIFQSLAHVLDLMRNFPFSIGKDAFKDFYFNKTVQRIETFETQQADDSLFTHELVINGVRCRGFRQLKEAVGRRIDDMYREGEFGIMHGDFCFNNILYDTFSGTVKLIDPRGSFGDRCVGIYGDPNYDLAKLLHSTIGHYDYIVNNLFQLDKTGPDAYTYSFPLRKNHHVLAEQSDKLLQNLGADPKTIHFFVGLLFLSMCPLHSDNQNRQKLMYLHGLYYINQNL
ncbi:MAG: aminoglycoside phosphotransferase family protein, partial [Bacteroidota bacterium]|nr:aminoglycoside phosphotransferase family protein [Bacteroidota bacterium]